jgi:hypothetical protein
MSTKYIVGENWDEGEVVDKAIAAMAYCKANSLKYKIVKSPIIAPIMQKYFNSEIKFTKEGWRKFIKNYKKYLHM